VLSEDAKVSDAAQLMAAKRCDCVLVSDPYTHQLSGILTGKDLAYRVVAAGLDPAKTLVQQVMTPQPFSVTFSHNAIEALKIMITRKFRHLPVVADKDTASEYSVATTTATGMTDHTPRICVLDITRCLRDALERMEKAFESKIKLREALEGVQRQLEDGLGDSQSNQQLFVLSQILGDKVRVPTLRDLLLSGSWEPHPRAEPGKVSLKTSVLKAAVVMKQVSDTAVLVTDETDHVTGILTSKDILLRVMAASLNPDNTTVVRVMTPHPECVSADMNALDALRKMYDGRFLHLPVVDSEQNSLIGMVSAHQLTCIIMDQVCVLFSFL
jgi:CBS domain-containing protein